MRSRRPEGSGSVRVRSPPQTKVRDHHRSNWRANPYREERFSPPTEHERLSRRALNGGERRSASVERRPFPGYLGGSRDDGGGQIRLRPLDESFPCRESSPSEYRRRCFDGNIEANPNSKHVGARSMGEGSSGGTSKMMKDKDFLGYGSSDFDGILKNSTPLDNGAMWTFMLPSDSGYSSSGFNLSKIGGSSTYPSTSSSFGGNLNTGISEVARYQNRTRDLYEDEDKQRTLYSRNVSYPMLPPSSASQPKAFGATASSSLVRDRLFSSYKDGLNLQSVGGLGGSNGDKFLDPLDRDGHVVGQKLFDHPTSFPEIESKDMKLYRQSLISPSRDEPYGYTFLELDPRERGPSFLSEEFYKKTQPSARGDYSCSDPMGLTFTSRIGDRIDDIDSSRRILRETSGTLWDHQKEDPIAEYHDLNRGLPLAVERHGELFNSRDMHAEFVTEVTQDHDVMHSGGDDYGFERDFSSMAYGERFNNPPLSDHGPDFYELDMDTRRRSDLESLGLYDHSGRTTKRKYVVDEINGHDLRRSMANTRSTSRHLQKQHGKNEHAKWISDDCVRLFPSKRLGLGCAPFKMPGKSFTGSREVTIADARRPCENLPWHVRAVRGRNASLKRRLRPGTSEFQNSLQFERRNNFFNKPRKFPKRSIADGDVRVSAYGEDAVEDPAPLVKTDPPEGSEEFKQQVHRAFLRFSKQLNENLAQKRKYREQGNAGSLFCSACGSLSKEFVDTHSLVIHAFNSLKVGLRTDHLGFHKALCVMMGWNSLVPPDNARAYHCMPAAGASALKEDLILWPPLVLIHNISIGKKNTSNQVVVTNERMEEILREGGFSVGSKVCRGKPANHSILVVKFMPTFSGLQEAERLHKYYVENQRGRKEFQWIDSNDSKDGGKDGESVEKSEELLLYGYMGIAEDLGKLDFETKKRCVVRSMEDIKAIADATLTTD